MAKWKILSNKSDCGNLSVWNFDGTAEECYKKMQALVLCTAANANPGEIVQLITDDSDLSGYILYSDEEREDFRCIADDIICNIDEYDNVSEVNLDSIPGKINWDSEDADYAIFDIGRE